MGGNKMEQEVICSQCGGRGQISILDEQTFVATGIVKWLERICLHCNGKGFILLDTEKLVKK